MSRPPEVRISGGADKGPDQVEQNRGPGPRMSSSSASFWASLHEQSLSVLPGAPRQMAGASPVVSGGYWSAFACGGILLDSRLRPGAFLRENKFPGFGRCLACASWRNDPRLCCRCLQRVGAVDRSWGPSVRGVEPAGRRREARMPEVRSTQRGYGDPMRRVWTGTRSRPASPSIGGSGHEPPDSDVALRAVGCKRIAPHPRGEKGGIARQEV